MPQSYTLLGDSGLFKPEYLSQNTVTFQEHNGSLSIVNDQLRGSKPQTVSNDLRKIRSYSLTHHPLTDALYPSDLAGRSAYDNLDMADTEAAALLRKMTKIKKSFAITREIARFKTLATGVAWAPNGTNTSNFYTDFGITRNEVDFVLSTASTDIIAKCEEIVAGFQSAANDGVVITGVTAYCSPAFFSKLIVHPKVTQVHLYQQIGNNNILNQRAGGMGLYRTVVFGNVKFIEVPTVLAGQTLIPVGDAIFVAEGDTDAFTTYFGPANRFNLVNTVAMEEYMWTFKAPNLTEITIDSESNMLNVLRKPQFVARGFSSN
jgi:hypothetical protein